MMASFKLSEHNLKPKGVDAPQPGDLVRGRSLWQPFDSRLFGVALS
jgi:hypothetical protein